MNRAEIARAIAACETLAKTLRAKLVVEAEAEFIGEGTVPSWKLPGITVAGATTNPSVAVVDEPAFLAWVQERYPSEVETIVRVRPAWQGRFLDGVVERGNPPCDPQGEEIPGLEWRAGGRFNGISMRVNSTTKALLAERAAEIASGARPLELPAVVEVPQP